jgi:hypothetical protein
MSYAKGTVVSPERSKAEIESLLRKYGATEFGQAWSSAGRAMIQFRAQDRLIRFELALPDASDPKFQPKHRTWARTVSDATSERHEAEVRRLWRALALVVKAKLEAVESGITTFEAEFLAHIVMPDGKTVSQHVAPAIAEAYATGKVRGLLGEGGIR